jgi:hypothetical protein
MSNRKTTDEQIEAAKKVLEQNENRLKELLQKKKDHERKQRTKRLIERGAILESLIPEPEALTNEQVKSLLKAALDSDPAIEILLTMQEQGGEPKTEQAAGQLTLDPAPAASTVNTAQNGGAASVQHGVKSASQSN